MARRTSMRITVVHPLGDGQEMEITSVSSVEEGLDIIESYEREDRLDRIYRPDYYNIRVVKVVDGKSSTYLVKEISNDGEGH